LSGLSLEGGEFISWKLFSILANVAQLLFVADCDRFGAAEKITLADIRLPVHRRAMYFMRSIAITTRTTDLWEDETSLET
jgi:hypothetical protein